MGRYRPPLPKSSPYNTGDNAYQLPGEDGVGTFYSAIWDAGGTDEIAYDGDKNAVLDLREATLKYEEGGGGFLYEYIVLFDRDGGTEFTLGEKLVRLEGVLSESLSEGDFRFCCS